MAKKIDSDDIGEFSVAMVAVISNWFKDNPDIKLTKKDFDNASIMLWKNMNKEEKIQKQTYIG